jgi:hypothetical protein
MPSMLALSVTDRTKTAGLETLEGRMGPLLLGEGSQAHTVRGSWVLCSQGPRQHMKPGSLYRFGANTSTGYEVPFREDACILIFKGDRTTKVEKEFMDYLKGLAARLELEHKNGTPFLLKELPADHPARKFAREVIPEFEREIRWSFRQICCCAAWRVFGHAGRKNGTRRSAGQNGAMILPPRSVHSP